MEYNEAKAEIQDGFNAFERQEFNKEDGIYDMLAEQFVEIQDSMEEMLDITGYNYEFNKEDGVAKYSARVVTASEGDFVDDLYMEVGVAEPTVSQADSQTSDN